MSTPNEISIARANGHNAQGQAFFGEGRYLDAAQAFQAAVAECPWYADFHANVGTALLSVGRYVEALESLNTAISLNDQHGEAHFLRSTIWLIQGDFARGWREYEWRWRRPLPRFRPPLLGHDWNGEFVDRLIVYTEQGAGDAFQFIRFVPALRQRCRELVVNCPPELVNALSGCEGVEQFAVYAHELPPAYTYSQVAIGSVPPILGTTIETIPATVPYMHIPDERVAVFRNQIGTRNGHLRVGIHWQGNPTVRGDSLRSIPLIYFLPLLGVPDVDFYSIQVGPGRDQLRGDIVGITDLADHVVDFADTAAAIKALDLIITSDSSPAHLAGALGVPVWIALSFVPDWRWLLNREDSPWYPTTRLFRQTQSGNWKDVFSRIENELTPFVTSLKH